MDGDTTMVQVGRHRLETTVFGSGEPAVVVEPSLGGYAAAWRNIATTIAQDTTVVTYNRAPYGASSPARDGRRPREIADDLHGVLKAVGVTGPLVLVGHSIGGIYLRTYAALHMERIAGMVLVDSSHETQRKIIPKYLSPRDRVLASMIQGAGEAGLLIVSCRFSAVLSGPRVPGGWRCCPMCSGRAPAPTAPGRLLSVSQGQSCWSGGCGQGAQPFPAGQECLLPGPGPADL